MTAFTDVFGGSTVQPSDVQFSSVTLSASIPTYWPDFAVGSTQVLARIMQVSASAGSLTVTLPAATLAGTGQDVLFDNIGLNTFTVMDFAGGVVATVDPGDVKYFYLADTSTDAGNWRVTIFGVGSSALDAAALAGYGIKAIGATLNTAAVATNVSGTTTVTTSDRSKVFVWTGSSGVLNLPTTSGSTSDFAIEVSNQGTGTITVTPAGGVLIDGSATIALSVGESCFVHMGATNWYTVGRGRNTAFNFTQLIKSTTGGTTALTLTEASNVVQKYTGTLVSNATITLPAVVQVYYVSNVTSGLYTLTFASAGGGSTVQVTQNQAAILFSDGTNIINANTSLQGGISTLQFAAGSVTGPSVAFNEVGTGFYQFASAEIGVTNNGVYTGRFTSAGWIGSAVVPTQAPGDDTTKAASTAFVQANVPTAVSAAYATIESPTFTGTVTIPVGATIDGFAPLASPPLTGTPTAPTATTGTSSAQLATTAFVGATAFNAALPSQTGNNGKFVTTDGSNASWAEVLPDQTGEDGKYLTTNAGTPSWGSITIPDVPSFLLMAQGVI